MTREGDLGTHSGTLKATLNGTRSPRPGGAIHGGPQNSHVEYLGARA